MKTKSALFAIFCLTSTGALAGVPGPLVTADWLAKNLDKVQILDVRKDTDSYMSTGHIRGARLVNYKKINGTMVVGGVTLKQMVPQAAAFSSLMKASGLNNGSSVVIVSRRYQSRSGISGDAAVLGFEIFWSFRRRLIGWRNGAMG